MSPADGHHLATCKHAALAALLIISGQLVGCGVHVKIAGGAGDGAGGASGGAGGVGSGSSSGAAGGSTDTSTVLISGTIAGLQGTGLVLLTNGVQAPISGNTFSVSLRTGSPYNIVPTTQPNSPTQNCTVSNGTGTAVANVSNVAVSCVTQTFTLSGTISGQVGAGLVLRNNGNAVPLSGNGFSLSLASGSTYNIVAAQQPTNPSQTCTITNGGPGVIGGANVIVGVACVTNTYKISVTANGLQNGATGLTVLDNGGDTLSVTGNNTFTFATSVASGQPYAVKVGAQPTGTSAAQYCIVPNGTGTVTNADITNVTLTCRNVGQALFAPVIWDLRNGNPGDIVGYTINPANGNLTSAAGSPYAAGDQPYSISLDTRNQILYAINNRSNDISTFSVSPTTGVLTGLHTSPGYPTSGGYQGGFSILVDPQVPSFVYAGSDQSPEGLVDSFTAAAGGVLNAPPPTAAGNDPLYMTIDPTGTLLFAPELFENDIWVYGISVTGALTPVAGAPFLNTPPGGADSGPAAIAVSPTARYLYVAGLYNATVTAYSYDDSGMLIALAPPYTFGTGTGTGGLLPGDGLTIDPTGRFLYVTSPVDNTVMEYAISAQTGLLTPVGTPVATGAGPSDAKVDPSGHFLYVSNFVSGTISEYVIDPATGALTEDRNSPFQSGYGTQSMAIE